MIPIHQKVFGNGDNGEPAGTCFRACLASIFEVDIDTMSDFENLTEGKWFPVFMKEIEDLGYEYHGCKYKEEDMFNPKYNKGVDGYLIVGGKSPRGYSRGHAVIYKDGKMVHDPHPSGDGILEFEDFYMIEEKE